MTPEAYKLELQSNILDILAEVERAKSIHKGNFNNFHEAYAVILEEIDELWDEIKKKDVDLEAIRKEAIQAAAMLCRLITECF